MGALENFERMLAQGRDDALLRYALGNEYLKAGRAAEAIDHLRAALRHDPRYSAAWRLLGRALAETGALTEALAAYRDGIVAAEAKGDIQAAREMRVFAKRIERQMGG